MSIPETIVTVRIPSELVTDLRRLAQRKRYMDLSELVRGLVRQRWLSSKDPVLSELHKMRSELKEEIRRGYVGTH